MSNCCIIKMLKKMLNFSVGPVMLDELTKEVASKDVPYFRTEEFSNIMFENENLIKKFLNARKEDKVVILTGSGTAAMEAAIVNSKMSNDSAIIVNGGSFGKRFCEIAEVYGLNYSPINLEFGKGLTKEDLEKLIITDQTMFFVNLDETSSGVLYDIELISEFCKKNNLFLVVDAISSFLADEIDVNKYGIDILIIGSQKALGLHPGISILVLSEKAQNRVYKSVEKSYYLSLKLGLENAKRGQTPFTPAVGIILQLNSKLKTIEKIGVKKYIENTNYIAKIFREQIKKYGFKLVTNTPSNAVTALEVSENISAKKIFEILKDEYGIWVCPNGGELVDKVFRVGHIGNIQIGDMEQLFLAFDELVKRGII